MEIKHSILPLKIVIPGDPIVKKNSAKLSIYTKKNGRLIPRKTPIHYYSKAYKEWARIAIQTCAVLKTKYPDGTFPITEQMNMKCLFVMAKNKIVDLSNLYEGIQDILAGNAGVYRNSIPSSIYKIIMDDNVRYIGSHDGSRVIVDYVNPRLEVILETYCINR